MNKTREWWEDFFPGPWGDLQAQGYPQEKTHAEVDFLVAALELSEGDRVLDLACGIGRHTVELAVRGFDVTGLDFNGAALALAQKAASEHGVSPRFVCRDMRQIDWDQQFDATFSYFSSFGYFEDEAENLNVAREVVRALRPGGRFLIDTHVTETLLPIFEERRWDWFDEAHSGGVVEEGQWRFETGRIDTEWTFFQQGEVKVRHSSLRVYSYRELCDLLRAAGFSSIESLETLTTKPFEFGSRRLTLVASE